MQLLLLRCVFFPHAFIFSSTYLRCSCTHLLRLETVYWEGRNCGTVFLRHSRVFLFFCNGSVLLIWSRRLWRAFLCLHVFIYGQIEIYEFFYVEQSDPAVDDVTCRPEIFGQSESFVQFLFYFGQSESSFHFFFILANQKVLFIFYFIVTYQKTAGTLSSLSARRFFMHRPVAIFVAGLEGHRNRGSVRMHPVPYRYIYIRRIFCRWVRSSGGMAHPEQGRTFAAIRLA